MSKLYVMALLAACVPSAGLSAQARPPAAPAKAQAKIPFVKSAAESAVTALATELEDNFVFPDKGKAYAAMLRANLAAGKYSSFADGQAFAEEVTADLQAIHKDGHLRVRPIPPGAMKKGSAGPGGPPPGFKFIPQAGWLADGVAYIRFEAFPGNEDTLAQLRSFLAAHKDAKSLIIDVRSNRGGGLAEMDVLFPQIFDKETTLVMMDTRLAAEERNKEEGLEASLRPVAGPDGVVRRAHVATPAVAQSGLAKAKIYLLTSNRTVSAGEHISLALKRTGRATLIGETTKGAGHYGGVIKLGDSGYAAFIPIGRTFDPDTNQGWEGAGVRPDIAVPADKALDEALKLAGAKVSAEAALASLK